MPAATVGQTPSLSTFIRTLKHKPQPPVETSIELLISLLKRRQIKNSRQCALATAQLLRRVVAGERDLKDPQKLIDRIRNVGRRLVAAQPREMSVGNVVRRVLAVVREVMEEQLGGDADGSGGSDESAPMSPTSGEARRPMLSHNFSSFSPLKYGAAMPHDMHPRPRTPLSPTSMDAIAEDPVIRRPALMSSASYAGQGPQATSLLSFLENPLGRSPAGTPPSKDSPHVTPSQSIADLSKEKIDFKAEVINGIKDLLDELEIVDTQIAESALDHIHSNETILTHTSSQTVQKFLTTAARKRKFTVVHAEAYPNDHEPTHATILNGSKKGTGDDEADADDRWKPLTEMGITVILIPDTAVFALMSRINKVIMAPHTVLANGSLLAAAGASTIALAAQAHRVPVVVLSGVYKLSPIYPFDTQELIEYGDPGKVVRYDDGEFMDKVNVVNPVHDWVDADLVSLYVTNLGGCAPSFLYRIVADHYRTEDIDLGAKSA